MPKIRLDQLLLDKGLASTIEKSRFLIISGNILVNNQKIVKSGHQVSEDVHLKIIKDFPLYVSRGGQKLAGAHRELRFSIQDKIALDVGISTGGFTDYLLQNGIDFVFGVDVAYGQVAHKLIIDDRLFLLDRTNARNLTRDFLFSKLVPRPDLIARANNISLVVMDLSFISILKVLPAVRNLVLGKADFIVLIKPQFEAEKQEIGPKGIIKDEQIHANILSRLETMLNEQGFKVKNSCVSPILGTKGNKEFFFWLTN